MEPITRNELITSREYCMGNIQNDLYDVMNKYMEENNLTRSELAKKLGVSKGYISQIFKGEFDHKISKLVELALACNAIPLLFFVNTDKHLENDANDKVYKLKTVKRQAAPADSNNENSLSPRLYP